MTAFADRFIEQGMQQGEVRVLVRQLTRRFGDLPEETMKKIESADADTLLQWSERVLSAQTLNEVRH